MASLKPVVNQVVNQQERALKIIANSADTVEGVRRMVAEAYGETEGNTIEEWALGEVLGQLRKALEKMHKSVGKLAQMKLDMG